MKEWICFVTSLMQHPVTRMQRQKNTRFFTIVEKEVLLRTRGLARPASVQGFLLPVGSISAIFLHIYARVILVFKLRSPNIVHCCISVSVPQTVIPMQE